MELKKLERDEFLAGPCGQWTNSNEKRGSFTIKDDIEDGTTTIEIAPFFAGGVTEDRVESLKIALVWTLEQLERFSAEEIVARITHGVVTDRDIQFRRNQEAELKALNKG